MLPGERQNQPSNPLEQYSDLKMEEMKAQAKKVKHLQKNLGLRQHLCCSLIPN